MPTPGEQLLNFLSDDARPDSGDAPKFDGADLRADAVRHLVSDPPPSWWDPVAARVRVCTAKLPGASLRSAHLDGVSLEQADLNGADLANACLAGAVLGGADLSGALLEDADLRGAHLRFAKLGLATLEGSDLRGADLWGAKCHEADLDKIDFRGAELEEADLRDTDARECDFRDARLGLTDFRGADLRRSDFRDAVLRNTKFDGADLRLANLEHADLSNCSLAGAWLADARLQRTRLRATQIGAALGEEAAGDWDAASRGYLTLERNFVDLGDPDAASWAYRKRRRMAKHHSGKLAREHFQARRWGDALESGFNWLSDWLVELVCDYGDSVVRVFMTYLVIFLASAVGYAATGAVVRDTADNGSAVTRSLDDVILYSLKAMVAPGEPPAGLRAASDRVQLITIVQSSAGVFLIGLLGFVAGNRIRR